MSVSSQLKTLNSAISSKKIRLTTFPKPFQQLGMTHYVCCNVYTSAHRIRSIEGLIGLRRYTMGKNISCTEYPSTDIHTFCQKAFQEF